MDGLSQMVGNAMSYTSATVTGAISAGNDLLFGSSNNNNNNSSQNNNNRRQSAFGSGDIGGGAFDSRRNSANMGGENFFNAGVTGGNRRGSHAGGGGGHVTSDDIFATAAAMRDKEVEKQLGGDGYNLSFVHHKNRNAHEKPYFFASPVGAPFPSYNSNPMPNFPARWTQVKDAHPPCENLLAPRIRLGPKELTLERREAMDKMRFTANEEYERNKAGQKDVDGNTYSEGKNVEIEALNLAYQCLGDPYQYEAFVTFMDLNRNVKILNLNDNELEDITDLHLDTVVRLHLSRNNFCSFEGIPYLPRCEELFLTENFLSGYGGLNAKNLPKLRVLNVNHNPIAMLPEYRQKLKKEIPTLMYVDGLRV